MPDQYLSTDPNAGASSGGGYISTDPHAGAEKPQPQKDAGYSPIKTIKENFTKFKGATFGDPVTMLSILGGMAAAVPSGGMSLLPHALAVGGGSALGAGAGQLVTGQAPSLGTMAKSGAVGAATDVTFGALPAVVRGGVKLLKSPGAATIRALDMAGNVGVPMARPAARILKFAKAIAGEAEPAAQGVTNTGGRLVRANEPTIEKSIGQALEETRTAPAPKAISTPPQPSLPAGYTPRSRAATARVAVKTAPKAEAAPKAAPQATPELPASWKALVEKQAGPEMPKPTATPLGIPEHAPMWASPQPMEDNAAKSLRHVFGAEDAGAMMDMSADEVRALSGEAAKHRPMVARLADLDRNYMRLVNDPKAALALTGTGAAGIAELMRRALLEKLNSQEP